MSKFNIGNTVYIKEGDVFGVIREIESDNSISIITNDDKEWYCEEDDLDYAVMVNEKLYPFGGDYKPTFSPGDIVYSYVYKKSGIITDIEFGGNATIHTINEEFFNDHVDNLSQVADYIYNESNRRLQIGDLVEHDHRCGVITNMRPYMFVEVTMDDGSRLVSPEKFLRFVKHNAEPADVPTKDIIDPTKGGNSDIFLVTIDGYDGSYGEEIFLIGVYDSKTTAEHAADATRERIFSRYSARPHIEVVDVKRNHTYEVTKSDYGTYETERYLGGYAE